MESIHVLRRPARRELVRLGRTSGDPQTALRFLAIAKLTAPSRPSRCRVAGDLGLAPATVVRVAQRYAAHGVEGLYDRRVGNGVTKVDDYFRALLEAVLYESPEDSGWQRPTWTRELLCLELERRGLPRVAVCTMGRALADIGARLGRPKPVVPVGVKGVVA